MPLSFSVFTAGSSLEPNEERVLLLLALTAFAEGSVFLTPVSNSLTAKYAGYPYPFSSFPSGI